MADRLTPDHIKTSRTRPRPGKPAGFSRPELAGLLLGIDPATAVAVYSMVKRIEDWEAGRAAPSPVYARALRTAIDC